MVFVSFMVIACFVAILIAAFVFTPLFLGQLVVTLLDMCARGLISNVPGADVLVHTVDFLSDSLMRVSTPIPIPSSPLPCAHLEPYPYEITEQAE